MDDEQNQRAKEMGARIQKIRKKIGMTQVQFGEQLDPQVGKQAVSAWEQGRNDPPSSAILFLAERGKVTTDYILRGKDSEEVNAFEQQLLLFFRGVKESMRDSLLLTANEFYNSENPGATVANPFPGVKIPKKSEDR